MTAAQFATFAMLYILFAKLFPLVSIWEIKEGDKADVAIVHEEIAASTDAPTARIAVL